MNKAIITLFIFTTFLTACKTEINETNVSGVWKAKEFESTIPGIPAEFQEAGKKEFLSSVYTLNTDNSLEVRSDFFKAGAKGHWEKKKKKLEVAMYYEMDTIKGVETYRILSLEKTTMVLQQDMPDMNGYVKITLQK